MKTEHMPFVKTDGGRAAAGYSGKAGDCVVRAVTIATEQDYQTVYEALSTGVKTQRRTKRTRGSSASARDGVYVNRKWFKDYMVNLGWVWVPTMTIGSGCTVHLVAGELPMGRLIVSVSKHYTTVIDGVVHDDHDPQRRLHWVDGRVTERCVYGYWKQAEPDFALV